jgi:outer membrane biosynthesis protein TonB
MPDSLPRMPTKGPLTTERRQNPRHPVRPTEYIEIGDNNGGIILDISEGGMAVASAQALVGHQTLRFRFQLPRSLETIETSGAINWIGETKKRAGVRFVDLPLAAREQIQKWIDSQTSGYTNGDQKPNGSAASSPSPKIPQQLPRREPVHHELEDEETTVPHGHNSSTILNPFSSVLSSPLDEPEIDESEPEDEEKPTARSNAEPPPERRIQSRFPMTASTYIQLSDGNGGLMANLSKTGFCVRAAKTLETDHLPVVHFRLPDARDFVESSAWIVWKSPSKKTVGARFENLSHEAQSQIAQWIDSQPLPKSAPTINPLSNNPLPDKIPPSPKPPAPVNAVPVTLMSPDSVPLPTYISPSAISPHAHPPAPPAIKATSTPSVAPSQPKVPPIPSPTKQSPPPAEKTLAPVPAIIRPPSSAKPAAVTSTPVSPQSQKPFSAPVAKPVAPVAPRAPRTSGTDAAKLTPSPNLSAKSFPVAPLSDASRDLKNPRNQSAAAPTSAAPFVPAIPIAPPIFNEPDWSVAPKRPTGYWKIAAMIVVIAGTFLGAATLLRSKRSATPPSQEIAQNSSVAASAPAVTPASDSVANSAAANQQTPSSTAPASATESAREFHDAPRNTAASKTSPKPDEQFVDEPRPPRPQPQASSAPSQSSNLPSRTGGGQPSSSGPAPIQNGPERNQAESVEQNTGFPEVVRRVHTASTPGSSNANTEVGSAPNSSSPPPDPSASRNQQPDANLASAAGVTQNSSSNERPAATSETNSSPRTASASINPSQAATTATVPASSASIPNPVPSVLVFSRFRSIRTTADAARPAGSDLQIGRLKSGPAPPYPTDAQRQQIQGIVELEVLVGADGNILTVHLIKGPPELASVAMGTVRSWQFGQTTLGGHPVETDQSIYFTFKLTK